MSEEEKIILCLIKLLKKNSLLDSHVIEPEVRTEEDALCAQKITEHRYNLIYTMCQPTKVMDYLESAGVIPRALCSRICYEYRVPEDRNRALIDFLHTRAERAYRPLIEALYLAGNDHLVELLDGRFFLSNARRQLDSAYRFPTALTQQTNVPTNSSMPINLEYEDNRLSVVDSLDIETIKYDDEVPMGFSIQLLTYEVLEKYPQLEPRTRTLECYRMLSRPRGHCLLINNVDAFLTMPSRQGSDIDASKLKSLFTQLGFIVILRRNLKFKDMISAIKNFAITIEEKKHRCDCAIVIILSHGGNGTIYSVDELAVDVERQIIPEFDDHLIGKPKLFIFQACRGSQGNLRPDSTSSTKPSWSSDSTTNVDGGNYTISQVPLRRDMIIWYSTIKDYVSWRTPEEGSIFIQSLITIFARSAWCHDFITMVDCVNRTMEEKFAAHESTPFQTPCLEYHFRYPLYFNPGSYEKTDGDNDDDDCYYFN